MSAPVSTTCTAIVVAFDSGHVLPDCLAALHREEVPVIVVDNASADGSAELAERAGARVIRNGRNQGYGRANNIGVRAADSELALIVNPDVVVDPGAIVALLAAAERYPDAGVLAPRLVEADGRVFFQPRSLLSPYLTNPGGMLRLPEGDCCAPFLSGACLLVRRELFLRLGGFDENIFLFYEDDDLCRRMADAGHSLVHVDAAVARHGRGRSSAPKRGRIFKGRWHQAWSRAYVSRKYGLPDPAPVMALANAAKALAARLTFNRGLIERYGGSAAGAWAFMRGHTALAQEQLGGEDRQLTAIPAWTRGPSIAEAMVRPHNNFTLIRLALALAVVVSHAFSVTTGEVDGEPLVASTGFTLGEHAVNGFFAISGFLVTMSFDRRGWRDYVVARTLRIAPALIAATLVVALVLGAALTRLDAAAYYSDAGTWRFIAATLTTFKSSGALPGVFDDNPFRFPMGTVWTLKYEVLCYAGVFILGVVGLLRSPQLGLAVVAGLFVAVAGLDLIQPDAPKGVATALRLPFLFAAGGALYLWGDRIRVSGLVAAALAAATALAAPTFAFNALLFAAEAYGVIWLALAPGLTRPQLDLSADLSYGAYLYGWPVQQALTALFPAVAGGALLAPALAITLVVAALSWFLVEKPALNLKARLLGQRKITEADLVAP